MLSTWQTDITQVFHGLSHDFYPRVGASLLVILLVWFARRVALGIWIKGQSDPKKIFRVRKSTYHLTLLVSAITLFHFLIESLQSFFTFLSLVAAALVITLKEPFQNLAGWVFILWRKPFVIGDRIEMGGRQGDVIDIFFFRTLLLELEKGAQGGQSTGGILQLPNGKVFSEPLINYSQGFHYLWHETCLHLSLDSDWEKAKTQSQKIALTACQEFLPHAEKELRKATEKQLIQYKSLKPICFIKIGPQSLELTLRYLSPPRGRRMLESQISEAILKAFAQEPHIRFEKI